MGADQHGQCPLVQRDVFNVDSCVRRPTCDESLPAFGAASVAFDAATLRLWHEDKRFVYRIAGLRLEPPFDVSPCALRWSRWRRVADQCEAPTALPAATQRTLATAIARAPDKANAEFRDVVLTAATECDASVRATIGARIDADGGCWAHVHQDEGTVRDATDWVDAHDGNLAVLAAKGANPIAAAAAAGETELRFPASHPMSRWAARRDRLPYVGRHGDAVDFLDLPPSLQTLKLAVQVGSLRAVESRDSVIACGSADEVANVPELGNLYQQRQSSGTDLLLLLC